ncbi:MAG: peptidase [Alphaproteobacteria bacterium]|nr:peptidase [Alphaproteobacteria bacterium]
MTYCLGVRLEAGLVLAADSRSNAGVDQVTHVSKQTLITVPGERVVAILSAGNLATSQAVTTRLLQAAGSGEARADVKAATSLFDVAELVGERLRDVVAHDAKHVEPYGDPTASFLVGGQIRGEPPRLFLVYPAGNFIEATARAPFLQVGETKYGKPILDRTLSHDSSLAEAAKIALLSFDATIRSNLSVGAPIDMLIYAKGSFTAEAQRTFAEADPYWLDLRRAYGEGLAALVADLPTPPGLR